MSCYGCANKFSFFNKERSCPNCGFSYCNKCLKEKVTLGEKQKNVCHNCHKKLTSNSDIMTSPDIVTPASLLNRLENLENPAKPPITIFRHSNRLTNLKSGLSSKDREILERLERLRAERTVPVLPDENEIKRRLALLQDRNEESNGEKPHLLKVASKSAQEEVDELLNQYVDETGLKANLEAEESSAVDEIKERLNKLQTPGSDSTVVTASSILDLDDEDVVAAKIIMRAIAEGKLEKKLQMPMDTTNDDEIDDDDLEISESDQSEEESDIHWCIICNEDATVKCLGCDGNLYCENCFKQGHEYFNMADHKVIPYKKNGSAP